MPKDMKPGLPLTPARPSSFVSLLSGWVQQGVESFFATQRILVDLAMRQNATLVKSVRETLNDPENSPMAILTEMAVEGTANFIEAQRILLDLAQQESAIVITGVKERVSGSTPAVAMVDLVRRSIDNFVDMQQEFLTITNKQAQNWIQAVKAGKGYDSKYMVDLARESMENFVNAQKKFLDVVAEETERATTGKPAAVKKVNKTEIAKLAQNAANSLIDAQKKLLDLAGQQINVNMQAANKTMAMMSPSRLPLASMTNESVKTFVEAEKAMMDSMLKPKMTMKAEAKPHRPAKRSTRTRKAESAQAVSA